MARIAVSEEFMVPGPAILTAVTHFAQSGSSLITYEILDDDPHVGGGIGVLKYAGGSQVSGIWGMLSADGAYLRTKRSPVFRARLLNPSTVQILHHSQHLAFCTHGSNPSGQFSQEYVGFYRINYGSATNWHTRYVTGGVVKDDYDTGIAGAQGILHEFGVILTPRGAKYIMNGRTVRYIEVNGGPSGKLWFALEVGIPDASSSAVETRIDYLYASQDV